MPAGFCGVTGLRPTHGLVSNRGVLPVSVSFDTVGPDGAPRRGRGAAALRRSPATTPRIPIPSTGRSMPSILDIDGDVPGLRIAMPRNFYFDDVDPEVEAAVRGFADTLARAGAEIVEVTLEGAEEAHRHATTIILLRRLRAPCRRARRQAANSSRAPGA